MKKFFKEFETFIMRGNVIDLAVGVIVGAAFQSVVTSLTENIISPIVGIFTGTDLSNALKVTLPFGDATLNFGAFITSIINFVVMAFVVFLLVKGINSIRGLGKKKKPEAPPTTKKCPYCYTDINIEATKCPNCTADLPKEVAPTV